MSLLNKTAFTFSHIYSAPFSNILLYDLNYFIGPNFFTYIKTF